MKRLIKYLLAIVTAFLLLLSCNTTQKRFNAFSFDFKNLTGQKENKLIFQIELSDSSSYKFYIITRFSYRNNNTVLPLQIVFKSPSGDTFSENIKLQTDYALIHNFVKKYPDDRRISMVKCSQYYDVIREYRTGVSPQEKGTWEISIVLPEKRDKLLGIGISAKRMTEKENERKK